MRVIDADRLQKQFDEKSTNPNYRVNMHNIKSIISNTPTVEAIPKDQYENRLKADMVAMLTEIQMESDEIPIVTRHGVTGTVMTAQGMRKKIKENIQQKIDTLKAESEPQESDTNLESKENTNEST